jgi:microsomal dipeptidase-like Zn-dependent dipeptidase
MAAKELKHLQDRVAELEKQLRELRAQVVSQQPRQHWPDRPHTEEEAEAFHRANERVREYIRKEREKDLKRVNAEIDRQIAREKKAAARSRKAANAGAKARTVG